MKHLRSKQFGENKGAAIIMVLFLTMIKGNFARICNGEPRRKICPR